MGLFRLSSQILTDLEVVSIFFFKELCQSSNEH